MDKKRFEKLEILFYIAYLATIIIVVLLKEQIYDEIFQYVLYVTFLFLFGVIHLKKFKVYGNEKFAKKNRWLWKIFNLASLIIILQSVLILFGVLPPKSIALAASICLFGDFVTDILIDRLQENEVSDGASFLFIVFLRQK